MLGTLLEQEKTKRNFRYENMWQCDPSYMALIRDAWSSNGGATGLGDMHTKLKGVQSSLQTWE